MILCCRDLAVPGNEQLLTVAGGFGGAGWRDRDLLLAADGIRGNASGIAFSCNKGDEKREERKGAKQRALGQVIPDNIAVCFAAYVSARVLRFGSVY